MNDLWAALCLVAIIEGLFLFALPGSWKRAMEQMQAMSEQQLRTAGGALLVVGLLALYFVRGG